MDSNVLKELIDYEMPYGKYKGYKLPHIPMFYLEWHFQKGFPKGKLGMMLHTIYEIKLNGLEDLLTPVKRLK